MHGGMMMPKLQNQTSAGPSEAGLLRGACHRAGQRPDPLARNDVDVSVDAVIARSAQRDEAISITLRRWDSTPQVQAPTQCRVLAERTRELVLAKRTQGFRFGETNPR